MLGLAVHHVYHAGGRLYDLGEGANFLAGFSHDARADNVLNKKAPGLELGIAAVDEHALALEPHGGVYVLHALESCEDGSLVYARGDHTHRLFVDVQGLYRAQKFRRVGPGHYLYLAAHAVSVHYLSGFYESFFHV